MIIITTSEFDDSKTVVGALEEAQKARLLQRYHKVIVRRGVRGKGRQEHDWVNHGTSQVILSKIFVRLEPRARSNKA